MLLSVENYFLKGRKCKITSILKTLHFKIAVQATELCCYSVKIIFERQKCKITSALKKSPFKITAEVNELYG